MTDLIHTYAKLLAPISQVTLFWSFTLDLLLHFVVGTLLTILLTKFTKLRFINIFFIVLLIELFKEFCDSFILTSTLREHLIDIFFTMIYPTIIAVIRKVK